MRSPKNATAISQILIYESSLADQFAFRQKPLTDESIGLSPFGAVPPLGAVPVWCPHHPRLVPPNSLSHSFGEIIRSYFTLKV